MLDCIILILYFWILDVFLWRSNQSILKEINPEYSLEGLMLKLQYFGHLMQRVDSLEKTLLLGKIEGKRKREWQRIRWLHSITDSIDVSLNKFLEIGKDREAWSAAVRGVAKSQTQLRRLSTHYCFFLIISCHFYLYYTVSIASFSATQCFMLCVLGNRKICKKLML